MKKKTTFSLLEFLVGFSLVALVIGVLSSPLPSLIRKHQFEKATDTLQGQLQLAYNLVLDYDLDLEVLFYYQKSSLICEIISDQKTLLSKFPTKRTFSGIEKLSIIENSFLKQTIEPNSSKTLKLAFSYYGGLQPQVDLILTNASKEEVSFLIQGFPHVIRKEKKSLYTS